jgi:hypothetical protein
MRSTLGRALAPAAAASAVSAAAARRAAMPRAAARTALDEHAPDGAFARKDAVHRGAIEPGGKFPPAKGSYCSTRPQRAGHDKKGGFLGIYKAWNQRRWAKVRWSWGRK